MFLPKTGTRLLWGHGIFGRLLGRETMRRYGGGGAAALLLLATCFTAALGQSVDVFETRRQLTERFLTVTSLDTAVLYTSCWPFTGNFDNDNQVFSRLKRDPLTHQITVFLSRTKRYRFA